MKRLIALSIVVAVLGGGFATSTSASDKFSDNNAWIKKWAKKDESIYPAINVAAKVFHVSPYTMRNIVAGEGGNVNPRTLRSSLCSYSGTGWNTQGSAAFGPFQFMLGYRAACFNGRAWGTFGAYDDAAFQAAKRAGVPVPYRFLSL